MLKHPVFMAQSTRDRIISSAKELFNQQGFGATTLYHVAQFMKISRGNLTYYFEKKENLLEEIAKELSNRYQEKMTSFQFPSWASTYNATKAFHELQLEYAFIFMDKQVMAYPFVQKEIEKIYKDDLGRQMAMISFSIEVGNMKAEIIPGTYHNLCRTLWTNSFFWLMSDIYQDQGDESGWDRVAWSLILPHFTEKGILAFKEHFGEDYFNALGKPYNSVTEPMIQF